jgi:tetratricopeptide (TPR) repeat protein
MLGIRKLAAVSIAGGLAISLPLYALHAGNREDARVAMARGLAALKLGDPRTARVELMNAIKAEPDWADARVAQARALLGVSDGVSAQAELDRAVALGAKPAGIRHLLAHALFLQGEMVEAIKQAEAPDGIPQQHGYALRIAGRAHMALGDMSAAGSAFKQALALAPRDSATWVDVGRYRMAAGDRAGAIAAGDRAAALAPGSAEAVLFRAELVRGQYGLLASVPWFERALTIDPNHVPTLIEYAATLSDLGEAKQMLAMTRRVIALDLGNAQAFYLQALMAARAGNDGLARSLLQRTGGRMDGSPAVRLLRAVLEVRGGNPEIAIGVLQALVKEQPENGAARLLLGRALLDAGRADEVSAILAPLVERADADSYALTLAARAREAMGDRAGADPLLARASHPVPGESAPFAGGSLTAPQDPTLAVPNIAYIGALIRAGQAGAAADRARLLQAANPGAPAASVVLGDALSVAGRSADAALAYEKAANLQFSEETALRLVSAWRKAGQPQKAARVLSLFLNQNPQSLPATRVAATMWMDEKNWDRAIPLLEAVHARTGGNDALLMADLAWAWLGKGDAPKALSYAANAYRLQPANPVAADAYGWALLQAHPKRKRDAVDLLEKAVALAPDSPMLRGHLDKALAATGQKDGAYAALSRTTIAPGG